MCDKKCVLYDLLLKPLRLLFKANKEKREKDIKQTIEVLEEMIMNGEKG